MIPRSLHFDITLFTLMIILIAIGILALYSAGYNNPKNSSLYLKQFAWFVIGLIAMILIFTVSLNKINNVSYFIYFVCLFLLILTLIFGKTIRGTKGWIVIGPLNFQFSELTKIATILALAKYLEYHFNELKKFKDFIMPFLIIGFPVLLILMQPDTGTALIFFPILIVMLFFSGADFKNLSYFLIISLVSISVPLLLSYYQLEGKFKNQILVEILLSKYFIFYICLLLMLLWIILRIIYLFYPNKKIFNNIAISVGIIFFSILLSYMLLHFLKDYQKKRLLAFIDPKLDPYGSGYNIIQSKITIGSGKLFGKGFLKGSQTKLGFLPEPTTDFIVSIIGEEFGWLGTTFLILIYFLFVYQGFKVGYNAKNVYAALVALGISTMFFTSFFINIGMITGIMPVIGIALPFLSYGGSSLVSSMIATAILINIKSERFLQ